MGRVTDYRELAQKLKPYISPWIVAQGNSQTAAAVSGMAAHALSGAYHTGTLAQSQAPWAVTDDEFATHTGNPDAHHARATATAPLVVSGQDVSLTLGHGVETSSSALRVKLPTNSGLVRDSTGVYLSPATVGADTTNSVTGSGHTHLVDSSSNPGAAAKILETAADGSITLKAVTVSADFTAAATAFRVINHTHDYPHTHVVVNPGVSWTLDEQFGVDIDDNLLVRGYIVGKHAIQLSGAKLIAHYDGPEPYPTNYKGEANGHMGQVATVSGGVVYRPGQFGKAVQIAGATTNLVSYPSFETGTVGALPTGWALGGSETFVKSAAFAHFGTYSGALTVSNQQGFPNTSLASNINLANAYTVSCWVYIDQYTAGTLQVILQRTDTFTDIATSAAADTTTLRQWQRLTATYAGGGSGSVAARVKVQTSSGATMAVYVDGVQVEQVAYATPYCDGSMGDGHSWSGTAHASTSSRTAAQLTYEAASAVNVREGTIAAWVWLDGLYNWSRLFHFRNDDGSFDYYISSGGAASFRYNATSVGGGTLSARTWQHVAVTWSANNGKITAYLNGAYVAEASISSVATLDSTISIGSKYGASHINGLIDDFVILDNAASADLVRTIYESDAPVFAESSTWHWRSGRNRVWADAEGLWMLGASGSAVLGAYAGDDANPSATKSWGGATMAEGDVVIGHNQSGSAAMVWDRSAGKFQFVGNGSATVQAEIATDGQISAGGGSIKLGQYGARLLTGTSRATNLASTDGSRIMWLNSEVFEAAEESYSYLGTDYYRRSLVMRTVTTNSSFSFTSHVELSAENSVAGAATLILESGANIEGYTPTYSIGALAYLKVDMFDIDSDHVKMTGNSSGAWLEIYQGSTTKAKPVLLLSQSDVSEEMIEFAGTVSTGNTINTDSLGSYYGRVRVSVNGTFKWLALYN